MTPLLLHPRSSQQLEAVMTAGVVSGVILHGPRSQGKATAARYIAARLNCQTLAETRSNADIAVGEPCGSCSVCRQLAAATYPDLHLLAPTGRPSIGIEQVRALTQVLTLRPYTAAGTRIVIIDEAQQLTPEAQNALLKLIEEPPPATRIILVAQALEALLPTVRSRLAAVYFAPVPAVSLAEFLVAKAGVAGPRATAVAELAAGAPGLALALAADEAGADSRVELDRWAVEILHGGLFARLLLAKRLADGSHDLAVWASRLQQAITRDILVGQAGGEVTATRLTAVEHFRAGLRANLAPRTALERLMVEL